MMRSFRDSTFGLVFDDRDVDDVLDDIDGSDEQSIDEQDDEDFDTEDVVGTVVDLIEGDFTSNEDQGRFAEIVEGLAFSDDPFATAMIAMMQDGEDMKEMAISAAEDAGIDEDLIEQLDDSTPGG